MLAPRQPGGISAHGIAKSFRGSPVLTGVSFEARTGDIVTVAGPNGSGKTTLLRIVAGLVLPDAGSVSFAGEVRSRPGWAPAGDRAVHWRLTARENLRFVARLAARDGRTADDLVDDAIDALSIRTFAALPLGRCSTGQRRRVTLAQAFVAARAVVVLDEPYSDLDANGIDGLLHLIEGWCGAGGVVVVAAPESAGMPTGTVDVELGGRA